MVIRECAPVAVTSTEKDAAAESLDWFVSQGGRVDRARIPDEHPAYGSVYVDRDAYLWVAPTVPRIGEVTAENLWSSRPAVFDVFEPAGRYLDRVEAGMPLVRPLVDGRHLYAVTVDELGVQYVVRMRVERW